MTLIIDNYDSFTYNLVQYFGSLGEDIKVVRNDKADVAEIERLNPQRIVISPGPGYPRHAGISIELIRHFKGRRPILGVCLGHQCIAAALGGKIVKAVDLVHGKSSTIKHDEKALFKGVKNPLQAGRYHSLIVDKESLPGSLEITAETQDGQIMGLRHKEVPIEGVQFHPESILTDEGMTLIENFLGL